MAEAEVTSIKTKKERREARVAAARARQRGEPEITKNGVRHLTGTCAGCVFWDTTDESVRAGMGVCRNGPPQLVSVPSQNGNVLQALWGVTSFASACGQHLTPAEYEAKRKSKRADWGM